MCLCCRNFSSSALDFLNVSSILLKDSSFTRCVSREPTPQFRANGGAVSVAYYYKTSGSEIVYPILDIQGCTFANNSVFISSPDELNQALINNTYSGRGGGLSLIIQGTLSSIWVGVRDTNFTGNWAEAYGGGFYVLISGGGTSHSISVDGCWFLNNYGGQNGFGGGLIFSLLLRNKNSRHVKVRINQCYFEDNIASNGAGLSIIEVCGKISIVLPVIFPPSCTHACEGFYSVLSRSMATSNFKDYCLLPSVIKSLQ